MRQLLDIFIASFKVGLMTFGGGYAMLPILQREVVESRKWVTEEEVLDYYPPPPPICKSNLLVK